MDFGLLLGLEWIVYSILLLSPYLFAIYRPVTPAGLHAACLKYCVCSLGGPVASVRSWHSHIFGTPQFRPSSILGRGPPPHACSAPYFHFHIGADFVPIPHRLVSRIQVGEFIEMRDLLADNISLHNQMEDFHGHIWPSTPAHLRPRLREVPSLSSWVYCFCAYIAVLTPDARTQELLAYCRLII